MTSEALLTSIADRLEELETRLAHDIQSRDSLLEMLLRDNARRREVEDRLDFAQRWITVAQENGGVAAYHYDILRNELIWAASVYALYGLDPARDPASMETWLTAVHPDDRESVSETARQAIEFGREVRQEYRVLLKNGEIRWISDRGKVDMDEQGRPVRVVGLNIDITELKTAQAALHESEANFRFTFEHAAVGVAHVAPDGRFLSVNRYLCEFLGLSETELIEKTFQDLTHPEDLEPDLDLATRMLAGELDSYAMEKRYVRPDGEIVWADLSVSLRRRPDGSPANFISVVADARARKAAEERLRRLNAELEARVAERTATLREAAEALRAEMVRREDAQAQLQQAQKMEALGRLVGGVAHDFNNVLAAIQGAFNLLDRRLDDPSIKFIVDEGRKAGERATDLVRQMLTFARREAVTPQPVDLGTSLPALTPMLRHALGPRVSCLLEVAEDIWPVLVDRTQLEIALLNLAVNAADAMPEGGAVTIRALNVRADESAPTTLARGEYVRLDVSDTGMGMSDEVLSRMFEPFFTTKAPGQGTGLGLAQVHGFTQAVGGAVVAVSEPGHGTTVSLYLPRSVVAEGLKASSAVASGPHGGAAILLVDDDNQVRPVTAAYLRDLGYSVIEAGSGGAALALIQLYPVDLLITDVVMPGIDGHELAARLRAEKADLSVLFMTGRADRFANGGEVVLEKPFTGEGLADHVLRALGRSG